MLILNIPKLVKNSQIYYQWPLITVFQLFWADGGVKTWNLNVQWNIVPLSAESRTARIGTRKSRSQQLSAMTKMCSLNGCLSQNFWPNKGFPQKNEFENEKKRDFFFGIKPLFSEQYIFQTGTLFQASIYTSPTGFVLLEDTENNNGFELSAIFQTPNRHRSIRQYNTERFMENSFTLTSILWYVMEPL